MTKTEKDKERDKERDRLTETDIQTNREIDIQTNREIDIQTETQKLTLFLIISQMMRIIPSPPRVKKARQR